ncbi:hypothetical protein LJR258_002101 [Rhizobium sp. LjRoot258]
MNWSLPSLMANLHRDVERRLSAAREALQHPGTKGDASEKIWRELLGTYLPKRYSVAKAHVCDSRNGFSQQLDVVVYDRQYSPLIFEIEGEIFIPAESVYAVFEAKQSINAAMVNYAHEKVASVRKLWRTSLPVPHAGGRYEPRQPTAILGGILALSSDWTPALGDPLLRSLDVGAESRLDIGCIASAGHFTWDAESGLNVYNGDKAATAFLLELIGRLQQLATVPMLDVREYARWLDEV